MRVDLLSRLVARMSSDRLDRLVVRAGGVECPGVFGSGLEAAVRKYQADAGLEVDGIVGSNTFKSLIS